MITLENFVVQCKMPWGKQGEERELYISQDAYYTTELSEAKFFKNIKNAKGINIAMIFAIYNYIMMILFVWSICKAV